MNALLVRDAASRLGVVPERVFGLAHEYAENPKHRNYVIQEFLTWYHENKLNLDGDVENFVIDVLAGRVTR